MRSLADRTAFVDGHGVTLDKREPAGEGGFEFRERR